MSTSASAVAPRPPMSLLGIFNMSFGFFGIQFGWGLQMANMSSIYNRLGAKESDLPFLWLAAPMTGFIVQPFIGYYSDRTWSKSLGRRRPYFLVGSLLASIALIAMPFSHTVWMAAVLLWILDASVNVSMEPFRAFVGDLLPESQRKVGFAMQSLLIGAGAVISSALPYVLGKLGVSDKADPGTIPDTVKIAFVVGAAVYFISVLYTIFTTKEHPPEDLETFRKQQAAAAKPLTALTEIVTGIFSMPKAMVGLAGVQFFTWCALFLMWINFGVGIATHIFSAKPGTPAYEEASAWAGVCFSAYNGVAFAFSFVLIVISRHLSPKLIHSVCLLLGGLGLASYYLFSMSDGVDKNMLLIPMVGVGIAWASILSMPYAMLASALPADKMGFYMGVFNFFIVLPQIIAALLMGWVVKNVLGGNALLAVVIGGGCMILAAVLTLFARDSSAKAAH